MSTEHTAAKTLTTAITLGVLTFFIEALGGLYANSLALLSDASHVFSDIAALIITLFALYLSNRPSTARHTFGYHRAEVFGALLNAMLLLIMASSIATEGLLRLDTQPEVKGIAVIVVGLIGILPNLWTVTQLSRSSNLNIRSAFWHALGDMISSVVVVISGVIVVLTGRAQFDAIGSLVVVLILVVGAVRLLRQVFLILFEGAPENINQERVSAAVCKLPGIRSTHDVHIWTLCSDIVYFTGHLVVDSHPTLKSAQEAVARATKALSDFGIHHATLQVETPDRSCIKEESCEVVHH